MTKKSFLYGAIVLFLANIVNRILGFGYQILAYRFIGTEGMGLFYMVYPIYILFIVLSTAGIPIAISKIIAEQVAKGNRQGALKVFKVSLAILFMASITFSIILFILLPYITGRLLSNSQTYNCFLALLPSIIIVSISSAFRGLFQGLQDMRPTAVAQIIEQCARITIGLYLAYILLPKGIEYATIGLSVGVVAGELAGFLTILAIYYFSIHKNPAFQKHGPIKSPANLMRELFCLSVPITLDRVISTILSSIDAILIPRRLAVAGFTVSRATEMFSQLQGIAMPLLFFPTTVTIALATTIIPAISDARAQNNHRLVQNRITDVMKVTFIVGLPSLAIFNLFPDQICLILYKDAAAGDVLRSLALGSVFLYFLQTITGVFQGLGHPAIPLKNMIISSVFKIIIIYIFTANPAYGIIATAMAINIAWIIESLLDIISLSKIVGFTLEVKNVIIKPAFCTFVMILFMAQGYRVLYGLLSGNIALSLLWSLFIGTIVYFVSLVLTKTVSFYEIGRMPLIGNQFNKLIYFWQKTKHL